MYRLLNVSALLSTALLASTMACSGNDGPTAIEIPLATVEITSPCPSMGEGETCIMAARGITADGEIVTNAVLRWSSNNGSVAQVNDDGRVFATGPGQATITVEAAIGQGRDTSSVTVFPCTKCN
jgi:hypothetical protein